MQLLYVVLQAVALALLAPLILWLLWVHKGRWEDVRQRLGFYAPAVRSRLENKTETRCWIHAASIGEAHVALLLIDALRQHRPDLRFVLSTMTEEGRTLVERRRPEDVELIYFPLDLSWCIRRAYRLIQPDLVILVEMELWPNHLWFARKQRIPVLLVNARMPLAEFMRYRRFAWFFRTLFAIPDLVCAQAELDAARLIQLGVAPEKIKITGHLKYDVAAANATDGHTAQAEATAAFELLGAIPGTPVLVAGSTHPGEEEILFDLLAQIDSGAPKPLMVIAPRDISRAAQIVALGRRRNLITVRRSELARGGSALNTPTDCLVLDTMGELPEFYALATVSFVGKSLTGYGGQNPIEAAANGSPVVFGANMQNFETITQQLLAEGGAVQVRDAVELRATVHRLLGDPEERRQIVTAAHRVIRANAGSMQRTVREILSIAPASVPRPLPNCAQPAA